jgi:hypothetical protein
VTSDPNREATKNLGLETNERAAGMGRRYWIYTGMAIRFSRHIWCFLQSTYETGKNEASDDGLKLPGYL